MMLFGYWQLDTKRLQESTLHLVLRLRGGVIEPSLAVLARKLLGAQKPFCGVICVGCMGPRVKCQLS